MALEPESLLLQDFPSRTANPGLVHRTGRLVVFRVIVSCSVGGLSLTQGDEHGEGFEEEP